MITWDVTITPTDVARKEATIRATRTDDTDPSNIKRFTHIISAILDTAAQKMAALEDIWAHHLAQQARDAAIVAYVGTLEQQAKVNLEAREI